MVTYTRPASPFSYTRKWAQYIRLCLMLILSTFIGSSSFSQVDFRQSANNDAGYGLGNVHWINSILQQSNSTYVEGMSSLQRVILLNVEETTGDQHTLSFSFQTIKASAGSHAYDFLTSWEQAKTVSNLIGELSFDPDKILYADLNECGAEPGSDPTGYLSACESVHSGGYFLDVDVPDAMGTTLGVTIEDIIDAYEGEFGNRTIRIWGDAPITAATLTFDGYTGNDMDANYTLSWTSTSTTIVVEFATHLAMGQDPFYAGMGYGVGKGAGGISGGPYHVNLYQLDGASLGSQDNQIKAADVLVPPLCGISPAQYACPETPFLTYSYTGGTPGATFLWTINAGNTAGAQIDPATGATGSTVKIVPIGADFVPGGTFNLTLAVTANGLTTTCSLSPAGTIQNTVAQATAVPDEIVLTAANHSSQLNARVSLDGGITYLTDAQADAQFTFSWTKDPPVPNGGTLSSTTIRNPVFTAAAPAQTHTFTVTATQIAAPYCSATAQVVVDVSSGIPQCPVISGPTPVCEGSTGLVYTAAGTIPANTTYTWSIASGDATITSSPVVNVTSVTVNAGTTDFVLRLTMSFANTAITPIHCDYPVTVDEEPDAYAGPDQRVCDQTSITLAATNPTVGTGTWTKVSGPAATITTPGAYNSTVTGLTPGTYVFRWTVVNGECDDYDDVQVIIDAPVDANAGPDQALCAATSATLAGNNSAIGTGTWTQVSGPNAATITTPSAYNTTVTGLIAGVYVFQWTLVNGTCTDNDRVQITVYSDVAPYAGPDQRLCDVTSVTLAATNPAVGTGTWTKVSGPAATITTPGAYNTTVTGLTPGTYVFRWTVVNGECTAHDDVQVIIDAPVDANAGPDQALCAATSATLAGNNSAIGTGTWTQVSGPNAATITTPSAYNTTVTGLIAGVYVFQWTLVNGTCTDNDRVQITVYSDVAPYAGPDQRLCDVTSVTLAATNPAVGTGTWTKVSGPAATITTPGAYNTTVTGLTPGTYVFRWTVVNGECTAHDDVQIIIDDLIEANAGPDQVLCAATSTTLAGNNPSPGTGTWTQTGGAVATITTPGAYNTTVTGLTTGTYTFRWTIMNGTCSDWDEVQVTIYPNPDCTISGPDAVCSASSNVYTGPAGMDSYAWSFVGNANGATFLNGITNTQSVTVIAGSGNYTLQLIVTDNTCSTTCTNPVTVSPCAQTICTYTQGAYGNDGGKHCTSDGQKSTYNTIYFALGNWPGDQLVIGSTARSLTIRQSSPADINAVIAYLPGGGGSATLLWNDGNRYISGTPGIPSTMLKNGRFNNTLLSQTLTLGLNIGLNKSVTEDRLGDFELRTDKMLVTATPAAGCDPSSSAFKCPYSAYTLNSSNVITFLQGKVWDGTGFINAPSGDNKATVMELFHLASYALGSAPGTTSVYGLSLGAIASLADQLNNIFDECQVFIGYMSSSEYSTFNAACLTTLMTTRPAGVAPEIPSDLQVAAYPNPYNNTVNFNFTAPVSGKALLEVYDVVGRKIAVVFEGMVDAGMQKNVNYNVPSAQRVPMIYRLTIGGKTSFGKLLPGYTD